MSMQDWKFAIKSIEDFKKRGMMTEYHILINGVNSYTGETEADYIAKGYSVLTEPEFDKVNEEYENSICGHWMEISERFYNQQMDILPPMFYRNGGFFISEADTGNIHGFYQELNGRYYTSLQRTSTKRENIIAELEKAIADNNIEDRTKEED